MTKTVLMGVRVYALDGDTERKIGEDRPKTLRTIQLLIHEKDAEAWTYANELGNIRLSLGSDADYSKEDGSNEAGQEFLAWLEEHRRKQEEALAAQKVSETVQSNGQVLTPAPKQDEGFSMIKMVEGRMMEYWIVPGKLPVLRGEVGKTSSDQEVSPKIETNSSTSLGIESDFDYLNGSESPFFQEADDRELNTATN
jgi:pilus assembly protein CpaB